MKILPAIDIKDGQAVRLFKGDFSQKTVVNPDVLEQARVFKEAGVTMIHVVDLEGALEGRAANRDLIARIKAETGLAIQVGGGIRSLEDVYKRQENIACGVLSEDAVYDLMGEHFETAINLLDLSSAMLKER